MLSGVSAFQKPQLECLHAGALPSFVQHSFLSAHPTSGTSVAAEQFFAMAAAEIVQNTMLLKLLPSYYFLKSPALLFYEITKSRTLLDIFVGVNSLSAKIQIWA